MEDNHEKLVSISDKSWHYRLIKYTFQVEGKEFKNLCPYFWLMMASLFVCPFVFIGKQLSKTWNKIDDLIGGFVDSIFTKEYNKFIENLSEDDLYLLYTYSRRYYSNNLKLNKIIPSFIFEKKDMYTIFDDWAVKHGRNPNKLEKKAIKFRDNKLNDYVEKKDLLVKPKIDSYRVIEKSLKTEDDRKRAQKIAKISKKIGGIVITILFAILAFFGIQLLILLINVSIQYCILHPENFSKALTIIGYLVLLVLVLYVILKVATSLCNMAFDKISNKDYKSVTIKEWIFFAPIIFLSYGLWWLIKDVIWKGIMVSTWNGIVTTVTTCGGIFGEYFGASYSDYCPGIEWEENEDN